MRKWGALGEVVLDTIGLMVDVVETGVVAAKTLEGIPRKVVWMRVVPNAEWHDVSDYLLEFHILYDL